MKGRIHGPRQNKKKKRAEMKRKELKNEVKGI